MISSGSVKQSSSGSSSPLAGTVVVANGTKMLRSMISHSQMTVLCPSFELTHACLMKETLNLFQAVPQSGVLFLCELCEHTQLR
jgi:hypothetical protein